MLAAIAIWLGLRLPVKRFAAEPSYDAESTVVKPGDNAVGATPPRVEPTVVATPAPPDDRQRVIDQVEATPIVFFGKALDQDDLPIAGARVTYTVHHLRFRGNPSIDGPITDKDGRFEIRTQGPSITVRVSHPQFYQGKDAERHLDYSSTTTAGQSHPPPTRDNPSIFRLVKKGQPETIIQIPSRQLRLPLDGQPVEVGFGEESAKISVSLGSTSIAVRPNEFRAFDWAVRLAVPSGGLIERLNALDFTAPEAGYLPEVEIKMAVNGNPRWSSRVNRDYFIRFANGKFGRFEITVSGETGFCRFQSYLNPSGSRNLEVNPASVATRADSRPE
ncbi:MAG TPA: hypothetical protein VM940_11600 [Chthoniobacterales bacterium]|jgi:hypothetical protein|nr:hypothetical protein [Chthoniobacterales bacterium]